jgi:hypothetical protein
VQHSIIVRVAWGLSAFLVLTAIAFAWAVNYRERNYAALIAEAERSAPQPAPAAGGADAAGAAAPSAEAARAAFDKRCAKCHEPEEMSEWVATLPRDGTEAAALEFLQQHKKAPEAENRVVAAHLAERGGL